MPKKGITSEEYRRWHSSRKMKDERKKRVQDRRKAEKEGKVSKGDGKELDHGRKHAKAKLGSVKRIVSRKTNRSSQPKRKGKA